MRAGTIGVTRTTINAAAGFSRPIVISAIAPARTTSSRQTLICANGIHRRSTTPATVSTSAFSISAGATASANANAPAPITPYASSRVCSSARNIGGRKSSRIAI